jgi:hypothetical protein
MPTFSNLPVVLAVAAAGALVAYAAYRRAARRATKRKAHDLRAELHAEHQSMCAAIEGLRTKIDMAKRSPSVAVHAAANTGPGELQQLLCELDLELSEMELSRSRLTAIHSDYESLSDMDVDINLVEVLALSLRVNALADRYRASMSVATDREMLSDDTEADDAGADDAEALMCEAPPLYSLDKPIVESVV